MGLYGNHALKRWAFNVAIHKLCKIQFWKTLFAIGFPVK